MVSYDGAKGWTMAEGCCFGGRSDLVYGFATVHRRHSIRQAGLRSGPVLAQVASRKGWIAMMRMMELII